MTHQTEPQQLENGVVHWEEGIFTKGNNDKFVLVSCNECGKKRLVAVCDTRRQTGKCRKCHTTEHYRTLNKGGEKSSRYKGRKRLRHDGYLEVAVYPGEPLYDMGTKARKGTCRYILEHRYVMALHLQRPLFVWEHIHHIDGDTQNNQLSNLTIVDQDTHCAITSLMTENDKLRKEIKRLQDMVLFLSEGMPPQS